MPIERMMKKMVKFMMMWMIIIIGANYDTISQHEKIDDSMFENQGML